MGVELLAGITSTVAMFPLETARTRLAVNHRQYRNMFDCLGSMARKEGLGSWYKVRHLSCHSTPPFSAASWGGKRNNGKCTIRPPSICSSGGGRCWVEVEVRLKSLRAADKEELCCRGWTQA